MKNRSQRRHFVILTVSLQVFCLALSSSVAEPYIWPLEESKNLSSGFCAHRDAHYHGGVDISTGGKEGLKVRAADSGYVFRLSTSYWGYGKAVYLKLSDGRIAVYGHLSQFSGAIREYVENQQYACKRYSTNLFPLPDELPIRRGEVIGYTGQSGYGPPHLHFEIRTADNYPLNPLALDVDYRDQRRPEFRGVVVRPLLSIDPEARVEGGLSPAYFEAQQTGRPGHYVVEECVTVNGAVGLAADCSDPTGYKKYDISPHRFSVIANDLRFFEITYDSLDFDLTRQVDLDYDFDWLAATGGEVRNLYRPTGSVLTWYDESMGNGILDCRRSGGALVPGENHIEIFAFDAAGNESVIKMTVVFDLPPQIYHAQLEESGGQWLVTGRAADPDDYVARLSLLRKSRETTTWEVVWEEADSTALPEDFEYIVPGPFAGDNDLRLTAVDRWGVKSSSPVKKTHALQSETKPRETETFPAVCDFAPGGLIVRHAPAMPTPSERQITAQIRVIEPPPGEWGFFVHAAMFQDITAGGFGGQLLLRDDHSGIDRILGSEENDPPGNVLIWPPELAAADPEIGNEVFSADSIGRVRLNAGDLYEAAFFRIRPFACPRELKPEPTSKLYSFEPISVPFARQVEVGISYRDLPATVDDLALYALENNGVSWKYLGRDVDVAAKFMTARVWSLGPYALIADTEPPKISRVIPGKGANTSNRRPEITFKIEDDLSGIDSDSDVEILLDGEWLIPEYDPETYLGKTRPRDNLSPGKHKLEIRARDRVGHEDFFLRYFTVVKKKG